MKKPLINIYLILTLINTALASDNDLDTDRDLLDSTVLPVKTVGGPPVTTPVVGTMTFNSSDKKLYIYDGTIWKSYSADS